MSLFLSQVSNTNSNSELMKIRPPKCPAFYISIRLHMCYLFQSPFLGLYQTLFPVYFPYYITIHVYLCSGLSYSSMQAKMLLPFEGIYFSLCQEVLCLSIECPQSHIYIWLHHLWYPMQNKSEISPVQNLIRILRE